MPGQFVSFTDQIGEKRVTRAYSIASTPGGNRFDLCLNLVKDGLFSPRLFAMTPGEEVEMKGPLGGFVLKQSPADSVMVATGTGVAPFRSIIPVALDAHPDRRFTLIFGVRYENHLLYREEWEQLARRYANFDFRPTLTRPPEGWTGRAGRVQAHVLEAVGKRRDLDVYICGLREMVDDVRLRLKELGFDRKQVVYERYD